MPGAGDLRDRLRFEKRAATQDEYGNAVTGEFASQFIRSVQIMPLKGGEDVIASRLQGTQPVIIIARFDTMTRTVTPEWRAVHVADGTVYAIRTAVDMDRKHQWIEMMAEAGVAA